MMKQIMKSVQYAIYCKNWPDIGCGYEDYNEYRTQKDATKDYRKIGWRTVNGKWTCPECIAALSAAKHTMDFEITRPPG